MGPLTGRHEAPAGGIKPSDPLPRCNCRFDALILERRLALVGGKEADQGTFRGRIDLAENYAEC
jgi:hypothetical protein